MAYLIMYLVNIKVGWCRVWGTLVSSTVLRAGHASSFSRHVLFFFIHTSPRCLFNILPHVITISRHSSSFFTRIIKKLLVINFQLLILASKAKCSQPALTPHSSQILAVKFPLQVLYPEHSQLAFDCVNIACSLESIRPGIFIERKIGTRHLCHIVLGPKIQNFPFNVTFQFGAGPQKSLTVT